MSDLGETRDKSSHTEAFIKSQIYNSKMITDKLTVDAIVWRYFFRGDRIVIGIHTYSEHTKIIFKYHFWMDQCTDSLASEAIIPNHNGVPKPEMGAGDALSMKLTCLYSYECFFFLTPKALSSVIRHCQIILS